MPTLFTRVAPFAFVLPMCFGLSASAVPSDPQSVVDLGEAPLNTIDDFEVEARNASCDVPQDFRFVPRGLSWLKLNHGSAVYKVARGSMKRFVALIDLSGLRPGRYAGNLDIVCDTCGDFVMSSCHIDRQSLRLEVEVVDDREPRPAPNRPARVQTNK